MVKRKRVKVKRKTDGRRVRGLAWQLRMVLAIVSHLRDEQARMFDRLAQDWDTRLDALDEEAGGLLRRMKSLDDTLGLWQAIIKRREQNGSAGQAAQGA